MGRVMGGIGFPEVATRTLLYLSPGPHIPTKVSPSPLTSIHAQCPCPLCPSWPPWDYLTLWTGSLGPWPWT
jgi:hypothetical protein